MKHTLNPMLPTSDLPFDSVYFLHWPGWEKEFFSNRWHYIKRWMRHLPTYMVQPTLARAGSWASYQDPRIPGLEVINISALTCQYPYLARDIFSGVDQLLGHMNAHGHKRPLLWLYNPNLFFLYSMIPATCRVYHATENYFDLLENNENMHNLLRATINISDTVVCCSDGVYKGLSEGYGQPADMIVAPNGCDFSFFATPTPLDPAIEAASVRKGSFDRTAVFAGNVNSRMNFHLMHRLAVEHPDIRFLYVGRVHVEGEDAIQWKRLQALPNLVVHPEVDPRQLPAIYQRCEIGIIPYRHNRLLCQNGLPLKALEMAASGIPVVSSFMAPLLPLRDAVAVAENEDDFMAKFAACRAPRSADARARALETCRANDYDVHFKRVLDYLAHKLAGTQPRCGDVSALLSRVGAAKFITSTHVVPRFDRHNIRELLRLPLPVLARLAARASFRIALRYTPMGCARLVPGRIKKFIRARI